MTQPRRKSLKALWQPCPECHWHRHGRCVCPRAVSHNGSKCAEFRPGEYRMMNYGPRFTGGRGSRPWTAHRAVEVY